MTELIADSLAIMLGGADPKLLTKTVTENDTYRAQDEPVPSGEPKYDGYSQFTVNVPTYEEEYEAMLECFNDMSDVIEEDTGERPADCEEAITAVEGIIEEKDQEKQRADEAEEEAEKYEECCVNVSVYIDSRQTPEEKEEEEDIEEEHPEIEEHPDIKTIVGVILGDDDFDDEVPIGDDKSPKKFIRLVAADCVVSWMIDYGKFEVKQRNNTYRGTCSCGWTNVKITQTTVDFTTMTISRSTYTTGGWDTTNGANFWGTDGRISDREAAQLDDETYNAYVASYEGWFIAHNWKTECMRLSYQTAGVPAQRRVSIEFVQSSSNGSSYAYDYYQSQWY